MTSREDLVIAVASNNHRSLQTLLKQCSKSELNRQDEEGNTALHVSTSNLYNTWVKDRYDDVISGAIDTVILLADHVNGWTNNDDGELAVFKLFRLCAEGDSFDRNKYMDILDNLLYKDGVFEECSTRGAILLHQAVILHKWDLVRRMIKNGVDVKIMDQRKNTALIHCAKSEIHDIPEDIVSALCHPQTINQTDARGLSPLMWAVLKRNSNLALLLVQNGADITFVHKCCHGVPMTAYSYALMREYSVCEETLNVLMHAQAVTNHRCHPVQTSGLEIVIAADEMIEIKPIIKDDSTAGVDDLITNLEQFHL